MIIVPGNTQVERSRLGVLCPSLQGPRAYSILIVDLYVLLSVLLTFKEQ